MLSLFRAKFGPDWRRGGAEASSIQNLIIVVVFHSFLPRRDDMEGIHQNKGVY